MLYCSRLRIWLAVFAALEPVLCLLALQFGVALAFAAGAYDLATGS